MTPSWIDHLPPVRGRYKIKASLAEMTWFRVGGQTDVLFRPEDTDDLVFFLKNRPKDVPLTLLGVGSNVLVRDGGISGIVIRLGRGFSEIKQEGDFLKVGAGCLDRAVALSACEAGLAGLEFLVGIPGTIGGAVKMNAGAYGCEMKDILQSVDVVRWDGRRETIKPEDMHMTYRHSSLPADAIVVGVTLQGKLGDKAQIEKRLQEILTEREASQPIRGRTGGSTFKNPENQSAWKLIDQAGCRGKMRGDAQVSEKHCNFLLNTGSCTAEDLELLAEDVRVRVQQISGVNLEWEIIRLGKGLVSLSSVDKVA